MTHFIAACFFALSVLMASVSAEVKIEGKKVLVETATLDAAFDEGVLVWLVRKSDGKELIHTSAKDKTSGYLMYANQEAVPLGAEVGDRFTPLRINDHRVDIRVEAYDGDGVLTIADDPETGDLIVELGAYSSRPGVRACRWLLSGINPELELVAPFFQGIKLPLEDPLIKKTHWVWPHRWEAGMAILQGNKGGQWIHCQDTRYIYKALKVGMPGDAHCLGLDTDAYGPIDNNLSAGGLAWRVNVFEGDWKEPSGRYRTWLEKAYKLDNPSQPPWFGDIKLALNSCPVDQNILDALAQWVSPKNILLHVLDWRSNAYADNFPDFTPSHKATQFVKKANDMGFHIVLHCPAIDIDPKNPAYNFIRDFQYRELENKKLIGWTWRGEGPVPESHADRIRLRDENRRVNMRLHAGLSMWRSILVEQILKLKEKLSLEAVYIDVTMNTHNVHNCLVENTTPTEGMQRLQKTIKSLGDGVVLAGEGRNEINMQDQCFSIVHLFKSWKENIKGLERIKPIQLSEFLFGRWSRAFGSSRLSGNTPEEDFRIKRQIAFGGIPTITIQSAEEIKHPNPAVREVLQQAGKGIRRVALFATGQDQSVFRNFKCRGLE